MASDQKSAASSSRLNQRSFGVTNKIWLLLLLCCFLFFVTHVFVPSAAPPPRLGTFTDARQEPKNYLHEASLLSPDGIVGGVNGSEQAASNPFDFCPVFGPNDDIAEKYGIMVLSQSRMHLGSGGRVHRVIQKALLGQPVIISVLGGSVSACHGAGDDPLSSKCYPSRFFQWWTSIFPHPASELTNGAMRRTNSGYFGYCSTHHVPDYADLIVVEFDTDDGADPKAMEHFELLIRSLLDRPDQPAVLILGHFSPQVHQAHGYAGPEHLHNVVAQFYDVPHLSVKPILYPSYMVNPDLIKPYFADNILANADGHALLADVLVSYFQSQICAAWATAAGHSYETLPMMLAPGYNPSGDTHLFGGVGARKGVPEPKKADKAGKEKDAKEKAEKDGAGGKDKGTGGEGAKTDPIPIYPELRIPPVRIGTRAGEQRPFEEPAPFCASANDLVNPLPPSLFYGSGWHNARPPSGTSPLLTAGYHWYATQPMSKLRVPIKTGAGDVGIYFLKEPLGGGEGEGEGSAVECWVDDNFGGAKIIEGRGQVGAATPTLEIIDHYVSRGNHYVECVLLGDEGVEVSPFKIIGIFAT
ncbi:hypothetical protein CONPUDRAFT_106666 [Coniophora puteana RWD-64-598 SS2]|uniref:Cap64 protein n=1 Tax=Coniophora puteana (strain RWD-64-598) TaxID=741705 RepID=A0A5M3MLD0_CONPW|nr:uncharacterized protein CONPUDRAFT_106666 [Coniophora puteana RWD-64-598 SS2]EIW79968.1 hypothetical protein CONPUDRAFT_106666 [Coniophora puteana RWD-64-598 SS2]